MRARPFFSSGAAFALLLAVFAGVGIPRAVAQVRVDIAFKRALFIRYEPIIAIVTIRNLSGRELELRDEGNRKWFGFQIETAEGRLIPARDPDYELSPVQMGAGQTLTRAINLTPLYPLSDYGIYRTKGIVYVAGLNEYFSSSVLNFEITEGRILWQQRAGVPEGGSGGGIERTVTLLAHRLPNNTQLYLRIEDEENGRVFCTHQLGKFLAFRDPEIELDAANDIHILQSVSAAEYLYSHVDLSGKVLERKLYNALKTKPSLRRDAGGNIVVVGGIEQAPPDPSAPPQEAPPSVSDRPVPLPDTGGAE